MGLDYRKVGLKCGIEIHQQLDTGKLFCSCPSVIREDEPDIRVERRMRAVAGELGDVDPAALHEFLRDRTLIYEAYDDTNCLVELDEEPPHPMNRAALGIVLKVALMLNAHVVDQLHVMRKTVVDGSNTTGFQRTVLVALDGKLETSQGEVTIPTICLEEDAARKIKEDDGKVYYRLDRLGIPLIEIATGPDIISQEHARETAEKIGMILRATGSVRRGLGTIRQDLNVSVKDGERVEVKGVQDLRLISKIVENEVGRQLMLLEARNILKERKVQENGIEKKFVDVTGVFKNTKSSVIRRALDGRGMVLGLRLHGFTNLFGRKLGPELAQYAKSRSGIPGIFHSDEELSKYGITEEEISNIKERLDVRGDDAFVIIAGDEERCKTALEDVADRCVQALRGVPKETRRALEDGRTEFMRPLPGSGRMYPETDEVPIDPPHLEGIRETLPELPEQKMERLVKLGLTRELASQAARSGKGEVILDYSKRYERVKPSVIATTILSTPKEVKKRFNVDVENIRDEHFNDIFSLIDEGVLAKDVIPQLLAEIAKTPEGDVRGIINDRELGMLNQKELAKIMEETLKKNQKVMEEKGAGAINYLMGQVMAAAKGRARPEDVRKLLEKGIK
ncbi:MAG: Glu-tRNA(Gln) amidotransferase subunit GatE [Candidatus Altiarchaeota archaeon]